MSIEQIDPVKKLPEYHLKGFNTEINFVGTTPPYNDETEWVWTMVSELLNNCVSNRLPNSDKHAENIIVTFENGKLTVEDDFVYDNPELVLKKILEIRDSGIPQTTKLPNPEFGIPIGGAGIFFSQEFLKGKGGNLDYAIKNGTIVAIATWDPNFQ